MNIEKLLASPPPATGWSIDAALAAVVRRQAKGELSCAAIEVPAGSFEVGPVGLQSVDVEQLRPVLARLQDEVQGSKRAAVVVPSGWLRCHLLEFDELPRRQADLSDVVQWRLKKLLPVPVGSLRLATVNQPPASGKRRLLVLSGVERAMASIEEAFESVGVSPGLIVPRAFGVAGGVAGDSGFMVIQQERGFLSLVLLVEGSPRLVRTKPLASDDWLVVERELGLTMGFIQSTMELPQPLPVRVSAESSVLADRLTTWVDLTDGVAQAVAVPPPISFDGTAIVERVGDHRLDPVVNVMSGGVR
jgi:hypothetical protein